MKTKVGEIGLGRIPQNLFFPVAVTGIPGQLIIPDSGPMPLRIGGGKDRDGGTDGSLMGGMAKMIKAGLVDFLFGSGSASIQNVQFRPKKTADASDAVSPGEPASISQFRKGEGVGAGFFDFPGDLS